MSSLKSFVRDGTPNGGPGCTGETRHMPVSSKLVSMRDVTNKEVCKDSASEHLGRICGERCETGGSGGEKTIQYRALQAIICSCHSA